MAGRTLVTASFTSVGGTVTKPVPEGYHTVSPYLAVEDAVRAIDYYVKAFGAKEVVRMNGPMARSDTRSCRSATRM